MTEAEWLAATDPTPMLEFLRGRVSDRKLRLFRVGGCRHLNSPFHNPYSLAAVEISERYADGLASQDELLSAVGMSESATYDFDLMRYDKFPSEKARLNQLAERLVELGALSDSILMGGDVEFNDAVCDRLWAAAKFAYLTTCNVSDGSQFENHLNKSNLLWPGRWLSDCIFGNPFRPGAVDPSWITSTAVALSQGIYDDRAFDRMPILADALQDAGCEHADILAHCRSDGPHVRGCWVVDLLTGQR